MKLAADFIRTRLSRPLGNGLVRAIGTDPQHPKLRYILAEQRHDEPNARTERPPAD